MSQYTGQCLCGACCYVIHGNPQAMYLCHCSRCQKETGTIHAATIFFPNGQLVWEKGAENISQFKLENTRKQRAFCKTCGCPLPREEGSTCVLPAGTLDGELPLEPTAHIFYASRAAWEDKAKEVQRFDELPGS